MANPTIKIGKVGRGVYDLSKTYNNTGSPNITQPDTSGSEQQSSNTYSAGNEGSRSEAQARSGYEKATKGLSGLPSWSDVSSDIKLPNTPKPPSGTLDAQGYNDANDAWTYDEYMNQYATLQGIAADKSLPITKEILRYGPTGYEGVFKSYIDRFGNRNTPIGLIDAQLSLIHI